MWRSLLAGLCVPLTFGLIEDLSVKNDDRSAFHIESFGFEKGGQFEFFLESFSLMVSHDFKAPSDDGYEIAFVLQRSMSEVGAELDANLCFHTTFADATRDLVIPLNSRLNWDNVKLEKTINEPGFYHLYYSNCMAQTHTTFHLATSQYNFNEEGVKIFLSAGLASLPTWFAFAVFAFLGMGAFWIKLLCAEGGKNTKSIHYLMLAVCVFKTLSLFTETFVQHTLKYEGVHDGWSAAFYVFSFIKGMILFTTIVLIGTGWSYLKPFLTDRDKQIILVVIVIQALVNIAIIAVDESAPGSYGGMRWRDILHVLDIICCCAILFPIVWSIRQLGAASGTDSKAAKNFTRLSNFRSFYLLVVVFVYFTRILLYLLEALLPYNLTFLGPVFNEFASFIFYGSTGYLFRPQPANPYLALEKDDDSGATMQEA